MIVVLPPITSCTLNFLIVCTHWPNTLSKLMNRWSSSEKRVPRLGDEHVAPELHQRMRDQLRPPDVAGNQHRRLLPPGDGKKLVRQRLSLGKEFEDTVIRVRHHSRCATMRM